jgi:hypothetical protein
MTGRRRVLLALLLTAAAPVAAQDAAVDEVRLLREATLMEAAGDLAAAERALTAILAEIPASAPALLAVERVLLQQRRLAELPPLLESALAVEPRSSLLNQLRLRVLSRLDRVQELETAAVAWMAADPGVETPYREVARTWQVRGAYDRARAALEAGRRTIDRGDALALELGQLYAALGEHRLAAAEWDRAIGPEGRGLSQVRRSLRGMPDGGAAVLPELVERLAAEPASAGRLAAAVTLAVDGGLESAAIAAAERLGAAHPGDRGAFLLDLARRSDGARLLRVAHWAYGELLASMDPRSVPVVRTRFDELAAELGEGGARAGNGRAAAGDAGPPAGRRAAALRIELLAGEDPGAARAELEAFRQAHMDAPELDRAAAAVAEALLSTGAVDAAGEVLATVRGPRSAMIRGRLGLARGDRQEARTAFLAAAPALAGAEATRVLSLVALLGRVSDDGAALLAIALAAADDDAGAAIDALVDGVDRLADQDRPPLLGFAAAMAEAAELAADARRIRGLILARYPASSEAPAALLALARSLPPEARDEARELLQRLVIEYPRSALAPQARRELEQLGRGTAATNNDAGQ